MPHLSAEIIPLLCVFAPAMTAPTYANALVLVCGAILTPGRRTVAAALRVLGLEHQRNFSKYHRLLNRARWSPMLMSRLLLSLLVRSFVPAGRALLVIVDDTLERRQGRQIAYKGCFYDPVRSLAHRAAVSLGIRWLCFCLLVELPWSQRPWALPFLVVPLLSEKTCQRRGRPHRSGSAWAGRLIERVRRWHPEREVVLVGDGSYAAVALVRQCQRLPPPLRLVSRLRMDAVLHDLPGPQPKSKRGRKPKKGARQPSLAERLTAKETLWEGVELGWYGGARRRVEIATGSCLWYVQRHDPVPIRWVLVRSPAEDEHPLPPAAFLCSDPQADAAQIVAWFVARWNIEVTFEEVRAHLGWGTQRHWSTRAIGRTTPCLLGLFSLVVLMAQQLHPQRLPLPQSGWYCKQEATFGDALAAVRAHLWGAWNYAASPTQDHDCLIPRALLHRLQHVACYAA
jgi:DDE superfamily endonuclease